MAKKDKSEELSKTLLKVALGFQVAEVTEEFAEVDGELKLMKRKRIKKDVPPDLKAVQLLLGEGGGSLTGLSDEELEAEKKRLLALLERDKAAEKKAKGEGQVFDESKKPVAKKRAKPRKRVVKKS
ncbi:MAG: hypothetical protein IJ514_02270 [Clostridia bacterium]|nr:hypothetical protein [Clostridia bacterium]